MARGTEDITRLPQWAQRKIARLEMRVSEAAAREAVGPEDSDTFANPYARPDAGGAPRPLGRGTTVLFGDERTGFHAHVRDGVLHVMGISGRVWIRPQSSNTFTVVNDNG